MPPAIAQVFGVRESIDQSLLEAVDQFLELSLQSEVQRIALLDGSPRRQARLQARLDDPDERNPLLDAFPPWVWAVLARTADYPMSNTAFDHRFNGIVVDPAGASVWVAELPPGDYPAVNSISQVSI